MTVGRVTAIEKVGSLTIDSLLDRTTGHLSIHFHRGFRATTPLTPVAATSLS
jgi:hypothetical protein